MVNFELKYRIFFPRHVVGTGNLLPIETMCFLSWVIPQKARVYGTIRTYFFFYYKIYFELKKNPPLLIYLTSSGLSCIIVEQLRAFSSRGAWGLL